MVMQISRGVGAEVSKTDNVRADPTWDWEKSSGVVSAARRGVGGRARAAGSCTSTVGHSAEVQCCEYGGVPEGEVGIRIHREYLGRPRNFTGYHFWAKGYCVSTVGLAEDVIRDYIRRQETEEMKQEKLTLG
jgi:putative transposase